MCSGLRFLVAQEKKGSKEDTFMNTEMWAWLEKFIFRGSGGGWGMVMGEEKKKKLGRGCWEQSEPLGSFGCKCN